ncbi:MAG: MgtC/SapB family protein [bacterium]|nr:MgtC/SapB family protein [bacterium]
MNFDALLAHPLSSLSIALVLGAFIGLQFQKHSEEKHFHPFAGLRTCMAITVLGFLVAFLEQFNSSLPLIISGFFLILILLSYFQSVWQDGRPGATTELSLVILFIVGILVGYGRVNIPIIITILLSIIATAREQLYQFSSRFSKFEIIETVKFAIIIFMILPLLPDRTIDPWNLINPRTTWLLVILISGISFAGYMASKFIGKHKSILLSGFIGGLVSSTAVTTTMSIQNKKQPRLVDPYTLAILLASLMMYIRVLFEVFVVNRALLDTLLIPIGGMLLTSTCFGLYYFYQSTRNHQPKLEKELDISTPLALAPAIKFSLFFIAILALIRVADLYWGDKGIYLTALFSGLADVDAISISLSNLSAEGSIQAELAVRAITYAVISNTLVKLVYIHLFGSKVLRNKVLLGFSTTSLVGLALSFAI